ncbi:hypothetical protein VE03_01909 [Pseudogymnoascus sp. 23342-1-I1]|nr:hypothetical protein VE03_01909 [Pseudogymnoascus sp. 23342-1-I1]
MKESSHIPVSFLNPTAQRRPIAQPLTRPNAPSVDDGRPAAQPPRAKTEADGSLRVQDVHHLWRSRDNRKGRHAIAVSPAAEGHFLTPPLSNTPRPILHNLWRMLTYYPVWDVSYLVAQWFTWGSVVWVINSFLVWLPSVRPSSAFPGESTTGGGISAFIGATIFEIGSVFLMIEAVNENRTQCFGWAFEETLERNGLLRLSPSGENCTHHHRNKKNLVGNRKVPAGEDETQKPLAPKKFPEANVLDTWVWFPSLHELRHHYIREIGFLACLAQFIAATVFWISGFTALPSIQSSLSQAATDGAYWAPQVIGGTGFIISSCLFMLETQSQWWKPAPRTLGWWVGAWNLVGAVGFTMSGAFGYWRGSKGEYQAGLATFWGSWAFLIGSVAQWYESLVKHPVERDRGAGEYLAVANGGGGASGDTA